MSGDGGAGRYGGSPVLLPEAETANQSPFGFLARDLHREERAKIKIKQTRQGHSISSTRESSQGSWNPWREGKRYFPFSPDLLGIGPLLKQKLLSI